MSRVSVAGRPETAAVEAELDAKVIDWMRDTGDPLLDGPVQSPFYRKTMSEISG